MKMTPVILSLLAMASPAFGVTTSDLAAIEINAVTKLFSDQHYVVSGLIETGTIEGEATAHTYVVRYLDHSRVCWQQSAEVSSKMDTDQNIHTEAKIPSPQTAPRTPCSDKWNQVQL